MKANELRIGNWINSNSYGKYQVQARDFGYIAEELMLLTNPPKPIVEPIPLTEEWLVKFGFKHHFEDEYELVIRGFRQDNEPYGKINYYLLDNRCFIHSGLASGGDDYGFMAKIQHVHQLQNLYFALTGEELTIKE
jgi:hypothetical protein